MKRTLGVVLVLLVCVSAIGPGVGAVTGQEDNTSTNATDTRHVKPSDADENGDLSGVELYLAQQLAQRLTNSTVQLSQGQYQFAKELVGAEYRDTYGKYVDVVGETGNEQNADAFRRTTKHQREFVETTQNYSETLRAYREAKRNGNEQRAQRLARQLERQAEHVSVTGDRLLRSYANLTNLTAVNLTTAIEATETTVRNVSATQAEIRAAEFIQTRVAVRAESRTLSFLDPLVVHGRLTTVNGTAIANERITLRIHGRTYRPTTNETGAFTVSVRPVTLPTSATQLTVRYRPNETSVYLGASDSLEIRVLQVDSSLQVTNATDHVAFDDRVSAAGRLTANGQPVPHMPVALVIAGQQIAVGRTDAQGQVHLVGTLPAAVPVGNQTLRLVTPLHDRAVRASRGAAAIQIASTPTTLTVTATASQTTITVQGRLSTADGTSVAGQPIEIRRNGSVVTTTRTADDGTYTATIPGTAGDRYTVTARYDDASTNLEASRASTNVILPTAMTSTEPAPGKSFVERARGLAKNIPTPTEILDRLRHNPFVAGGIAVGLFLIAGVGWFLWRRKGDDEQPIPAITEVREPTVAANGGAEPDPLADAEALLADDTAGAVERAYRAVRTELQNQGIGAPAATHWEFYRACQDADLGANGTLESLTVQYEQAAFGKRDIPTDEAQTALEAAEELLATTTD